MPVPLAAALSHVGRIRSDNQDSGYAGAHLYLVADGMGGHAGGDVASALVVRRVRDMDQVFDTPEHASEALVASIKSSNQLLQDTMREHPELAGMGTTFSGILRVGDKLAIAHIGDSRIYRWRDRELTQISTDHTFVQKLVEAGRITKEEAETHPRRNVVMRVLGNVETDPEIDAFIQDAVPGDRWLVCSDGLSSYVSEDRITTILGQGRDAEATARRLVSESLSHGAPDNVTVVLMDVTEAPDSSIDPVTVGSASSPISYDIQEPERSPLKLSQLILHPLTARQDPAFEHFEPESEEYLQELLAEYRRYRSRRRISWGIGATLALLLAVIAGWVFYDWTQDRYYVGANDAGYVAIFQGIQQELGPVQLAHEISVTDIEVDELSTFRQQEVERTINADSLDAAKAIVQRLEDSR